MRNTETVKLWTNEEFVSDIINYSPYGALSQILIIDLIGKGCKNLIDNKESIIADYYKELESGKVSIVNMESWVNCAQDIYERFSKKYGNV